MTKKLNKKQVQQIAKIWAGSMLFNLDSGDSFQQDDEVIVEVKRIAYKILGDNPILSTVDDIIRYVKKCQ